jgi:hypothetical protein
MGIEAALAGHMTYGQKYNGNFLIKPDGAGAKHAGKPYAYDNDIAVTQAPHARR